MSIKMIYFLDYMVFEYLTLNVTVRVTDLSFMKNILILEEMYWW